jgi:chromosome segregation ATPase
MVIPVRLLWVGAALVAAAAASGARAQTPRSGGAPNAQLLMQLQELGSEKASLESQNADLKKQLDAVTKERDTLKGVQKANEQRVRTSAAEATQTSAQRDALAQELKRTKDQMDVLIGKFRETINTLREIETDRAVTKQTLATRSAELKVCIDRNLALYKLDEEVLTRLDQESVWSRIAESEPFTKIKRVQLENLIDDYRNRAEDQRVSEKSLESATRFMPRPAPAAAPSTSAPAAPAAKPQQPAPASH